MPLPTDERVVSLAGDLLQLFHKMFGPHPGFRPAHAKGLMLTGTFAPSPGAQSFTRAPVIFQEVVHSILTGEAVCDEQAVTLETEWTITRMPHGRL